MRYVAALIWAFVVFVVAIILLGALIGQMFDGIKGAWGLVPMFGQLTVAAGAAAWAFRAALRPGG
jgi:hypothetical protein